MQPHHRLPHHIRENTKKLGLKDTGSIGSTESKHNIDGFVPQEEEIINHLRNCYIHHFINQVIFEIK